VAVHLGVYPDKYAVASPEIDCAARLPLCRARCCTYQVVLTRQDVEEGRVKFEIDKPYFLRHEEDGYCTHLDRQSGLCAVHGQRPAACRVYDCRTDRRVWIDFEKRVAVPMAAVVISATLV
jgi:Fe-S-cluster containining protein